jgi:hypothetical protein
VSGWTIANASRTLGKSRQRPTSTRRKARDQLSKYVAGRRVECIIKGKDRYALLAPVHSMVKISMPGWCDKGGRWHLFDIQKLTLRRKQRRRLLRGAYGVVHSSRLGTGATGTSIRKSWEPSPSQSRRDPSLRQPYHLNVNRSGKMIYHLPGQLAYSRINMEAAQGRRWFCTEEEAQAAGWRPAAR